MHLMCTTNSVFFFNQNQCQHFCFYRTKNFSPLTSGFKYSMKYRDDVAILVIHDVSNTDAGSYSMEASNQYGHAASSASLRVKGEF